MPLLVPPGYANWIVTIRNTGAGLSARNTIALGTDVQSNLTQSDVNRISNLFRDNLKTLYDSAWEVGPTHVIEGHSPVNSVFDDTTVESGTASAAVYAPPNCAVVVSKQTGLAARSTRGRFYLPGVPQQYIGEGGGINPTWVTTVQTAVDALQTALVADTAITELVLFHDEPSSPQVAPTTVNNLTVRTVAGTMRPRLRRT